MNETVEFPWKSEYALGIPDVDRQHRELFRIVNRLYAAAAKGNAEAAARRALERLINYACYHFGTEERIFRKAGLPEAAAKEHIGEHEKFIQKVRDFRDNLQAGKPIGPELAAFAADWLLNHTSQLDVQYAKEYLKEHPE